MFSQLTLPGKVHCHDDRDALLDELAATLMASSMNAVKNRGVFHLALSGGSTPEPFYMRLILDSRYRMAPWQAAHFWIVDERRVPHEDPKSNYRMIREVLLDHLPIKKRQIHPMPVAGDDPAADYEAELWETVGQASRDAPPADASWRQAKAAAEASDDAFFEPPQTSGRELDQPPRLDFILLGMGDDGHTASLFPGSQAVGETSRLIVCNEGDAVTPPPRVTMTYPLINAAREVAILVTGQKKAAMIQHVAQAYQAERDSDSIADIHKLPVLGVRPAHPEDEGKLHWFVDGEATGIVDGD